jgi:DNA-binding PadR family transcriptional regulator
MARLASAPAKTDIGGLGRFSEPALLILAALAAGAKHGYAIIQDVEAESGQRLGPGTLYGAISRLEGLGFIEALDMGDRGRRPYRITAAGTAAFQDRMRDLTRYQAVLNTLAAR